MAFSKTINKLKRSTTKSKMESRKWNFQTLAAAPSSTSSSLVSAQQPRLQNRPPLCSSPFRIYKSCKTHFTLALAKCRGPVHTPPTRSEYSTHIQMLDPMPLILPSISNLFANNHLNSVPFSLSSSAVFSQPSLASPAPL